MTERPAGGPDGAWPPSVDALARSLSGLPQPLLVDAARQAIAEGRPGSAQDLVDAWRRRLLSPVVNATGVLLHTNLGRAPVAHNQPAVAQTVEFDVDSGERGSRQGAVGGLLARLCDTEAAMVVNNNAAAILLVLAALASGRSAAVSRGESVEIGGGFRVPEVIEQSGARLVDVGTTNRTRLADYRRAIEQHPDLALILKVHTSNFRIEGFTETVGVAELATLGLPVVVDLGGGLLDSRCPWLPCGPPRWLGREPAAVQTVAAGADVVTFSGDKLLGGPQAGIIAGRADLVERCAFHPLARALRPGGLLLSALQDLALTYLRRDGLSIPFWRMASASVASLEARATALITSDRITPAAMDAVPGAGAAPGTTIPSFGLAIVGDHLAALRGAARPVIGRIHEGRTLLDLRSVDPADDPSIAAALLLISA